LHENQPMIFRLLRFLIVFIKPDSSSEQSAVQALWYLTCSPHTFSLRIRRVQRQGAAQQAICRMRAALAFPRQVCGYDT
jgi:hypothetical protein